MVSWSALGRSFGANLFKNNVKAPFVIQNVKFSVGKSLSAGHGHKTMALQPSRYVDSYSDYLTNFTHFVFRKLKDILCLKF